MNDKAVKTPPTTRVYPITVGDTTRYIEATSPAAALTFAFKPHIGAPLTAKEAVDIMREHGVNAIEVAQ